jgi:hypothetical protein
MNDQELAYVRNQYVDENGLAASTKTSALNKSLTDAAKKHIEGSKATVQAGVTAKTTQGVNSLQSGINPAIPGEGQITEENEPPEIPTNPSAPADLNKPADTPVIPKDNPVSGALNKTTPTASNPAGSTYIANPDELKTLKPDQIWRDPNSTKIYKLAGK